MGKEQDKNGLTTEQAVRRYFNMVYKLAVAQTKNTSYADDVVQEVFLKYIPLHDTFESENHRKAWLIRVTVNCSKDIFRSSWFKKTEPLNEDMAAMDEEKSDLWYAVMELPQKYRTVIHLFYYEELSVREISEYLKIGENTVKSQLHRGREILRKKLKGGYDFV